MTVYRYLTGRSVTRKTRQKIEGYLERTEYRPNLTARSLVFRKTRLIGLLVPSVSYSYYPEVVGALQKEIRARGYNLLLCVSEEDPTQERAELDLLLSMPVDGIIISPTSSAESESNCRMLEKEKPPFVMFDRYFASVRGSYVTTNSFSASAGLVQHLVDLGHRRIAHIGGPPSNSFAQGILRGYRSVLRGNGLPLDPELVHTVAMDGSDCVPAFEKIVALPRRPSAIQAVNDPVAIELLKASRRCGVRIPEDMAIVGFSDSKMSSLLEVPLTTVREPTARMAATAVEVLFAQIGTKSRLRVARRFRGEIVIRRSSGRRRRGARRVADRAAL
jgi:DNA-binding LacI/PurR family transcriptional regulator